MITMTEFAILAIAATVVAPTGIVASLCLACMWGNKRSTYVENQYAGVHAAPFFQNES